LSIDRLAINSLLIIRLCLHGLHGHRLRGIAWLIGWLSVTLLRGTVGRHRLRLIGALWLSIILRLSSSGAVGSISSLLSSSGAVGSISSLHGLTDRLSHHHTTSTLRSNNNNGCATHNLARRAEHLSRLQVHVFLRQSARAPEGVENAAHTTFAAIIRQRMADCSGAVATLSSSVARMTCAIEAYEDTYVNEANFIDALLVTGASAN